jgi:hypothetical protein
MDKSPIFYEKLLLKYIIFLNEIEGRDFIDEIGNRMHEIQFTKEEHDLLLKYKF